MRQAVVAGAMAAKPGNAGSVWERLSFACGLRKLGWHVHVVEQITSATEPTAIQWAIDCCKWFDFEPLFLVADRPNMVDIVRNEVAACDLFLNLSGNVAIPAVIGAARVSAFIDVDPGFTQIWLEQRAITIPRHDHYFTIGELLGTPACRLPTGGLPWKPTRQPVVLQHWPVTRHSCGNRFSTISSWRSYGAVTWGGVTFPQKHHEFRRLIDLPRKLKAQFEIVLDIHSGDDADKQNLINHDWHIREASVINTPAAFRDFIQNTAAEFSVCQGIYSLGRTGWFSDRSVRYLASGKPVLVPATGSLVPSGEGLVTFTTLDDAIAGAESILADYTRHSVAARVIAEEWFDSDRVLSKLLAHCGLEAR